MRRLQFRTQIFPAAVAVALLATLLPFAGCASGGGGQGGFNLISLEEEWSMRNDLHRQVQQEMRLVRDSRAQAYLNQVGNRLADQTALGDRRWDFHIVDNQDVNAFNLPGGLVYVNSGLIAEAEDLEQLTGVLAHEIGHGAARHGTQLMTRAYGYNALASLILGQDASTTERVLAQLVGTGVLTNYSRGAEHEADELGVSYAYRGGYDPSGMVEFFKKLVDMRGRRPGKVQQFFGSHPLTEERIARVEAAIARLPQKGSLVDDTREYQSFRSKFR